MCALGVVLVLASLEKYYSLDESSLHSLEKHYSLDESYGNGGGSGYGGGTWEGQQPASRDHLKTSGAPCQRHISVKAVVGPRLATLQRSFGSKVVVWVTQSQSCRLNMTSPSSQRGKIAP